MTYFMQKHPNKVLDKNKTNAKDFFSLPYFLLWFLVLVGKLAGYSFLGANRGGWVPPNVTLCTLNENIVNYLFQKFSQF